METMARLLEVLDDLRRAAIHRSRILNDEPMLGVEASSTLESLDGEMNALCQMVVRAADKPGESGEERAILYALVTVARTVSRQPYTSRSDRTVTAQFTAARKRLRHLSRTRPERRAVPAP